MFSSLSGDISLKPRPTSNRVSQCFWKPFKNKGLHFLFFNVNSILPKLDEWGMIAGKTKTAIIDLTESNIDSSLSHREVEFTGYCIFWCAESRNGGGVSRYVWEDLCCNLNILLPM